MSSIEAPDSTRRVARTDLPDLQAFATIVRLGSFRAAAAELGLTPSALSHSHRRLEERLGVRLLNRTTRSIAPTEIGDRLLAELAPAIGAIEGVLGRNLASGAAGATGRLRLNVPQIAARTLLAPNLVGFLRVHAGVRLEIAVDDRAVDVISAGFDAGIRFGRVVAQDMVGVALGEPQALIAAASPRYIARCGTPQAPADLTDHDCLAYRLADGSVLPWRLQRDGARAVHRPEGGHVVSDPGLAVRLAVDGLGIAYTARAFMAPDLAAGRLVSILSDWRGPEERLTLYHPDRRHTPPPLRAFIDYMQRSVR